MATEKKGTINIVLGDSFANWTPSYRERLLDRYRIGPRPRNDWQDRHDAILEAFNEVAPKADNQVRRDEDGTDWATMRCTSPCCAESSIRIHRDDDLERKAIECAAGFSCKCQPGALTATKLCDSMDDRVDGLTVRECMDVWLHYRDLVEKRIIGSERAVTASRLTLAQFAAGKAAWLRTEGEAWSASLRTKQAEAREKERCQVLVDIQDDES